MDHYRLSLAELIINIRKHVISPLDLAESLLDRIDILDPTLHAWVTIDRKEVLDNARRLEAEMLSNESQGILHGIPIGLKDIFYTAGTKTTACSPLFADFLPSYDATTVTQLKSAGAIILGKAVTTEFANADPSPTLNPWNLGHTPGGSSCGPAVAVATGMCPGALGSQTGGSTLRPAAYNGVVGLKPTYGRISRHGVIPVSWSLDHVGILTKTVEDAAIMLQVLAGHDSKDPSSSVLPVPSYTNKSKESIQPPRIGVLKGYFYEAANEEVRQHTSMIVSKLESQGAYIEEIELPASFLLAQVAAPILMNVECAAYHQKMFQESPDFYGPLLRERIEMGLLVSGTEYLQTQRIRRRFLEEMETIASAWDVLLTPTTMTAAPLGLITTGDAGFQSPWSFCGLPSLTLPSGLNVEGLPLGIQIISGSFRETDLLDAARWCEVVLGFKFEPPGVP